MRQDSSFRATARHLAEDPGHTNASNRSGISGESVLSHLKSIDFPRSFPPDSMHLFFENIIPTLVRHYRGVFFKGHSNGDDGFEADDEAEIGSKRKGKTTTVSKTQKKFKNAEVKPSKFRKTDDPWNVPPDRWELIGTEQKVSS
jgi:hypothetical protein